MDKIGKLISVVSCNILVFVIAVIVLYPNTPEIMKYTYRDSGVFLYAGWRILSGDIPYIEIWDHKPPIIFFLNALGIWISGGSRWGVWILELVFLIISIILSIKLIRSVMGIVPAYAGTILWVSTLTFLLQGGNLTNEYILPLQIGALYFFSQSEKTNNKQWRYFFLIGLFGSLSFFTKQTSIAVYLAIGIYLFLIRLKSSQYLRLINDLGWISLGATAVAISLGLYFALNHGLSDFWDSAFRYNFFYGEFYLPSFINNTWNFFEALGISGLIQLASIGILLAIFSLKFKLANIEGFSGILVVALLAIPIELVLLNIPGRGFNHYSISTLPVLSIFVSFFFWSMTNFLKKLNINLRMSIIGTAIGVSILLGSLIDEYVAVIERNKKINYDEVVSYIQSHTSQRDTVLLWGAEASINFFSHRRSPTRFVYQYPLFKKGYSNTQLVEEFFRDIEKNRPGIIIDTHNPITPFYNILPVSEEINQKGREYFIKNYQFRSKINGWDVYHLREEDFDNK